MVILVLFPILLILVNLSLVINEVTDSKISRDNFFLDIQFKRYLSNNDKPIDVVTHELQQAPNETLNANSGGFGLDYRWHSLSLKNVAKENLELVLLFDNPTLDVLEIYTESEYEQPLFRLNKYSEKRSASLAAMPRIDLNINSDVVKRLIIKTQTDGSPNLPILIFHKKDFDQYTEAVYLLWGGFIGIVLLMSIYNLILYVGNRETLYLIYIAYITLFLLVLSVLHGFGVFIFTPPIYKFISQYLMFFYFWLGISLLAFTMYFLKFNSATDSNITKVTRFCIIFLGLLSFISFFIPEYQTANFFFPIQTLIYILCLVMVIRTFKHNSNWAKYYVLSWFPLLAGAAIGTMFMVGAIEYTFWTRHATMLSVMFEMAFISMALAERVRISESQRLYEATHDALFDLPNFSALKTQTTKLNKQEELANYSLILVKVCNFPFLNNTLSRDELVELMISFSSNIELNLSQNLMVLETEEGHLSNKVYVVAEGVFAFLISSNDLILMSGVLKQLPNKIINRYPQEHSDVLIDYKIGVSATSKNHSTIDVLYQQASLALEKSEYTQDICSFFTENMASQQIELLRNIAKTRDALGNGSNFISVTPLTISSPSDFVFYEIQLENSAFDANYQSFKSLYDFCKEAGLLTVLYTRLLSQCSDIIGTYNMGKLSKMAFMIPISIDVLRDRNFVKEVIKVKRELSLYPNQIVLCCIDFPSLRVSQNILNVLEELNFLELRLAVNLKELPSSWQQEAIRSYFEYLFIDKIEETENVLSVSNQDVVNALTTKLELKTLFR